MIKKIIIGIVITAVLSLVVTGSIYAYNEEQFKTNAAAAQGRQSKISDMATGKTDVADRSTGNKNESVLSAENKNQRGNTYGENEKNDNCEPAENNYSWEHNYSHKNENCSGDDCFQYNYRYEHNYRYENSCGECDSQASLNQKRNGNGR